MAKANNTAIEQIFDLIDNSLLSDDQILGLIEANRNEWLRIERRQIENAYNSAKNYPKNYQDSQHYFFMEYIDND